MKSSAGFTLVELIVTITLVGILVGSLVPTFNSLTNRTQRQVNLSNMDPEWRTIKFNSCETYGDICKLKKRPRIKFVEILRQLDNKYINVIFNGNISEL